MAISARPHERFGPLRREPAPTQALARLPSLAGTLGHLAQGNKSCIP